MAATEVSQRSPVAVAPFNPFTPAFQADPYAVYQFYREHEPVHRNGPEYTGQWYLFRHADCSALLRDTQHHAHSLEQLPPPVGPYAAFEGELRRQMLFRDPPDHTRLRALVNRAFTPRMIEQLRPRIQAIVDELLDAVQGEGAFDLIADFAFPLPACVIAEMIGVPSSDRDILKRWSSAMIPGIDKRREGDRDYVMSRASTATLEFSAYLRDLIVLRRNAPQEDLLSALLAVEERGDQLSEAELVSMCILLLNAGHETTTNLIGNGVLALLEHPDQLALLRETPGLIGSAVDELLRYNPPVQLTSRIVDHDLEIGGKHIRRGESVNTIIGAANRDPEVFNEPNRLDIKRGDRRYLSFGHGIHYCLGAPLARLEGQLGIGALLERMPKLRLLNDTPEWSTSIVFRSLVRLPVACS